MNTYKRIGAVLALALVLVLVSSGLASAQAEIYLPLIMGRAKNITFVSRPSGLDSTWSEDIALGDLDGDHDLDIFLGHRDAASSTWFNDGIGHFTTNGLNLGNPFLIDVALGDVDGDTDLDVILAGIQENVLWLNDGHGNFSSGGEIFPLTTTIGKVALGDLDGDGDLDAATATWCTAGDPNANCTYSTSPIWLNDGGGHFSLCGQSLGTGTAPGVALRDMDGDGDLDAVIVHWQAPGSAVWQNVGLGVFTRTQTLDSLVAVSVDLGDLDGDGDLDAFVAPQGASTSAVWLNDGHGTLAPGQHLGSMGPVVLGDLDEDGDLDAFSINDGADKVWVNQGNATFVFAGQNLGEEQNTGVSLGDLDGDGDLDAVTSGYNTKPSFWMNQD